jgi:hypothetical protein
MAAHCGISLAESKMGSLPSCFAANFSAPRRSGASGNRGEFASSNSENNWQEWTEIDKGKQRRHESK